MTNRECTIKVIAMPADTNSDGNIFGGWILSQMDLAGVVTARKISKHKVVTVAIDNIQFLKPVFVGDLVECFTSIEKIGKTSITIDIEVIVERKEDGHKEHVTKGKFVYVAMDDNMKPVVFSKIGM